MSISLVETLVRLAVALAAGAVIGWERESKARPAGLRTHLLVALGSATAMIVSTQFVYYQSYGDSEPLRVDPSHIGAAVLSGIGFLGAGVILRVGLNVRGLTTAASVWLVSAIGLAAGAGMHRLAVASAAVALFALTALRVSEGRHRESARVVLELRGGAGAEAAFGVLREMGIDPAEVTTERRREGDVVRLAFDAPVPDAAARAHLVGRLEALEGVVRLRVGRTR